MSFRSDSPDQDFARWDAEQQRQLELLPVCSECGEAIQDDFCYQINDEIICEDCLNQYYLKFTADLVR